MIGIMGLMIGVDFSIISILIVGWILCLIVFVLDHSDSQVRERLYRGIIIIRKFIPPPTGGCDSCGDRTGYYIGDDRYLACKVCGGRR